MEIQNQNYFLLHCFGFWVYLTYQGGAGERQEQLLASSVSSPLGGTPLTCPGWDTRLDVRKLPRCCTATDYVTKTFGYTVALVYDAIHSPDSVHCEARYHNLDLHPAK